MVEYMYIVTYVKEKLSNDSSVDNFVLLANKFFKPQFKVLIVLISLTAIGLVLFVLSLI